MSATDSIIERAKIACGVCGCPWDAHPEDCPRHAYRPKPPVVHSGYVAVKAAKPDRKRKGKPRA